MSIAVEPEGYRQKYDKPPIVEAVLEVRFDGPISDKQIEKIKAALRGDYPASTKVDLIEVIIDGAQSTENRKSGQKCTTLDQTDVVIVTADQITVSRLSPYLGWDDFYNKFIKIWKIKKEESEYRKITRVGLRYINRIDVPAAGKKNMEVSDYLLLGPNIPDLLRSRLERYVVHCQFSREKLRTSVSVGIVPPAVLNHVSIVFDIDVSSDLDLPQNNEGVLALVKNMRISKNEVFESCVTDMARALFGIRDGQPTNR